MKQTPFPIDMATNSEISTTSLESLLIIGGGSAGYSAAIYAGRAGLAPVLFEGDQPGGALATTTEVENFPGIPSNTLGPDLMSEMRRQVIRFGTHVVSEAVTSAELDGPIKTICTANSTHRGMAVIIATGSAHRRLHLAAESELTGRGVSYCATCDGYFFRNRPVAVVGGGDSAIEEALFLTRFASHVTVVHRRNTFRASRILMDLARSHPKITWVTSSEVAEILGADRVTGLRLRNSDTLDEQILAVDAVFVAIGHYPRSELFRGQISTDPKGYIVATRETHTSVVGVFVAGDVADPHYRQAITAAGSGCQAALDAQRYLAGLRDTNEIITVRCQK
ncbi:thioredoxin-disulfide reductase [Nocardia sp. CA-107356]|uniref:thioredoxin-disulfide reductase n=1 Tax=Nocardia sp. CA-107356 TaxID=3239972 RepID=UPI003D8E5B9D